MRTIRGMALGELAAEEGKKGFMELIPAAGIVTKVTRILWNSADTDVNLIYHTATQTGSGAAETVVNKDLGGNTPLTTAKTEAAASISGTVIANRKHSANADVNFDLTDAPIIIKTGAYLIVACNAVNKAINNCTIEFHEIKNINA